jgi:MFS family permease
MIYLLAKAGPTPSLIVCYLIALASIIGLITAPPGTALFFIILAISGAVILGSQYAMNAVVAEFYPAAIRATACGYAGGVGRAGAILAPALGGVVVGLIGPISLAFGVAALPTIAAFLATVVLHISKALKSSQGSEGGRDAGL